MSISSDFIRAIRTLNVDTIATIIYGVVEQESPLRINIGSNIILPETFFIVNEVAAGRIFKGDKVMMLELDKSQTYLVLEVMKDETNMFIGDVVSVSPLKISIEGKQAPLEESELFLGQMCRPHKVTIPHKHEYNGNTEKIATNIQATTTATVGLGPIGVVTIIDPTHEHQILKQTTEDVHMKGSTNAEEFVELEIHPKLKNGDKVLLFAMNKGKMYYVAERIEP